MGDSKVTPQEKLYWFCQLVLRGYSSSEAKRIVNDAVEKVEKQPNQKGEM